MARVTKFKPLYPWLGGLNTSLDPMIMDPQDLTICDNIIFSTSGARKKRGGQDRYNTSAIGTASANVIFLFDYWATVSNAQRERFVAVTDDGKVYRSPLNGTWSSFSTLTLSVSQGGISAGVMQNDLVIGMRGNGVPKVWDGQNTASNLVAMTSATTSALPFTNAWIVCPFLERGFYAGDPANPDKVYVSKVGTYNDFTTGTSGFGITLNVGLGDGDPSGITAIFPGTAGDRVVYVGKRRHLYRIDCSEINQANWKVTLLSNEIGVLNPGVVQVVDQADVIFASDRGVHSLSQVVNSTAIVEGQFLSFPIQNDWNNVMSTSDRLKYCSAWVPSINSYLLGCKRSGESEFETIYGFNIELQKWFRWTNVPCHYLMRRIDTSNGVEELYSGGIDGFVNELLQDDLNDFGSAIVTRIQSSFIAPEGAPFTEHKFINLACIYRAHENSTFRVYYSVDGLTTQSVTFEQKIAGGNLLGSSVLSVNFLLGQIQAIKPVWNDLVIEEGNTIQFTFEQDGIDEDFELFGMVIEHEFDEEAQNAFRSPLYS